MKRNNLMLIIAFSFITLLATSCSTTQKYDNSTSSKIMTNHSDANIKDLKPNIYSLENNSDAIIIGKVKTKYSYKLYDTIFTNYKVNVQRKIGNSKFDLPNEIEIRFTGGQVGDENEPILEKVKPLEQDETYMFVLKKVFSKDINNNFYAVLGGEYQGTLKVETDNNIITKVDKFNDNNKIEKSLLHKNIESIIRH